MVLPRSSCDILYSVNISRAFAFPVFLGLFRFYVLTLNVSRSRQSDSYMGGVFTHIRPGAYDAHVRERCLVGQVYDCRHTFIRGGTDDVADGKDLVAVQDISFGDSATGRVDIAETCKSQLSRSGDGPMGLPGRSTRIKPLLRICALQYTLPIVSVQKLHQ